MKLRDLRVMPKFGFQDLKIWQRAIEIADELFDLADELEEKRLHRFAEQMRGAEMSMSNNIAEGSGPCSKRGFGKFLNVARRSTFDNANILILLRRRGFIAEGQLDDLLTELDSLCRQTCNFQESLIRSSWGFLSHAYALCSCAGGSVMKSILDQMEEHIAAIRDLQRNFDFHSKRLERLMRELNENHLDGSSEDSIPEQLLKDPASGRT